MLYVMSIINTNPSKYSSINSTEWIYITKNLRCKFEFFQFERTRITVTFEKYIHWSLMGFHFRKKWRYLPTEFNNHIMNYTDDFFSYS